MYGPLPRPPPPCSPRWPQDRCVVCFLCCQPTTCVWHDSVLTPLWILTEHENNIRKVTFIVVLHVYVNIRLWPLFLGPCLYSGCSFLVGWPV